MPADTARRENRRRRSCAVRSILALPPVGDAGTAQNHKSRFFIGSSGPKHFAGLKSVDKKAHPVPLGLSPWQMEEFSRVLRQHAVGMDQKLVVVQSARLPRPLGLSILNVLMLMQEYRRVNEFLGEKVNGR